MKITKVNHFIIFLLVVFGISSLLFARNENTFIDFISKKIHKETKDENDQNINIMLRFSNLLGRKLISAVNPDYIEKIYIPYKTEITPEQISYLFQQAVFKEYKKLPATHLLPTGTFSMLLKNQTFLVFHTYMGAPMIRVTSGTDEYWLEIPDHKTFYALGSEKEIKK